MKFLVLMASFAAALAVARAKEGARFVRAAKSSKATNAPTETKSAKAEPPGYSYCTWAPDKSCYQSGWPACCAEDGGKDCPRERPGCDRDGASYCVWAPDYQCYQSGWPACCAAHGGRSCPPTQPVCDRVGASYCTWSPENSCYASGWPACCAENQGRDCPDEQPACDMSIDDCVELGNTAAELVVLTSWCEPGQADAAPFRTPEYLADCKKVAVSICEGYIYTVAQDWCPDKSMNTNKLLTLQGGCEDQVDSMVPGMKLALE